METSPRGRDVFGAFGLLVLGVALRVVRRSPWLTWLALVLAVAVVALSVVQAVAPFPALPIAIAVVESLFYFYATGSLIAYMLQDWSVRPTLGQDVDASFDRVHTDRTMNIARSRSLSPIPFFARPDSR